MKSQCISAVFCPDFFPGPLLKASPGRFTSQKNHLALLPQFQRSRIPRVKVKCLRIFSKNFQKFFFQLQASQSQETSTQLVLQVDACGKCSNRREKWAIINLCSLTWRWLMTILVWACYVRKKFENWKLKLSRIQNSSEWVQSIPKRFNSSYIVHQHHWRTFDPYIKVLTPSYPFESSKQLSTFHLPSVGDGNVLAKSQVLPPYSTRIGASNAVAWAPGCLR